MLQRQKFISVILIGCLLLAFSSPAQAQSVTNQVYSDFQVVTLALKIAADDKRLTVSFPKAFSDNVDASSFEFSIQETSGSKLSAPVSLTASSIKSATVSYAFNNLTNKTAYRIQVTAYSEDGDIVAQGSANGTPVAKLPITGVTSKAGDGTLSITFNKLTGVAPTSYQIQYWSKKDAKGNPIWEKPITIKASSLTKATFTYTFTKLKNGTLYHFNLSAEKNGDTVALTSNVTAMPKAPVKKK
ncbi:fibronectin type III domain-containing protein [Cohnella endophytica]|nr:fibronectin type III domain-containing protein [Cohnella endophytica]